MIYRHSGMSLAGIHSFYNFWIPAFAGMTEEIYDVYNTVSVSTEQVLTFVLIFWPLLCC